MVEMLAYEWRDCRGQLKLCEAEPLNWKGNVKKTVRSLFGSACGVADAEFLKLFVGSSGVGKSYCNAAAVGWMRTGTRDCGREMCYCWMTQQSHYCTEMRRETMTWDGWQSDDAAVDSEH